MTSRLSRVAFWILLALLVAANAIVMWHSLTVLRFWEDEAFNLTVPRNLLAGLGYTSDGTLSGSTLTPFDPRISTGPAVLLPVAGVLALGADPVIGARLVPLAYWVLLLVGLGVLGRRLAGRSGALIAVALPLAFNTADSVSPIQGPADLLGEIAAAALIVWALIALPRRAWLAGLLLGLAVQAKLIALLALPAFAVALFLLTPPAPFWRRLGATVRRGLVPLALVAAPTALMEAVALVSLGFAGYARHVRAMGGFLLSGGQHIEPTTIPQKLGTLAGSWFLPWWLVAAAAVLAAVVVAWAAMRGVRSRRHATGRDPQHAVAGPATAGLATAGLASANPAGTDPIAVGPGGGGPADADPTGADPAGRRGWDRRLLALGFGSAVGLLTFVGWWAQAAQLPLWVRHPAVGVFAFAPVLAAIAVRAAAALWRRGTPAASRGGASGAGARVTAVAAAAVLGLVVAGGAAGDALRALRPPAAETLTQQRAAVAPLAGWIRDNGAEWLATKPWGGPVSSVVLTGAHVGLFDAPAMRHTPILTFGSCDTGSPLAESGGIVICPAP